MAVGRLAGLTIVKQVVEEHGGQVSVDSAPDVDGQSLRKPAQALHGLLNRLHHFGQLRIYGRFRKGKILPSELGGLIEGQPAHRHSFRGRLSGR
jgi:signal transduction histidine kinase